MKSMSNSNRPTLRLSDETSVSVSVSVCRCFERSIAPYSRFQQRRVFYCRPEVASDVISGRDAQSLYAFVAFSFHVDISSSVFTSK